MVPFTVKVEHDLMNRRDANTVSRGVMRALARHHLRVNLPKHFERVPETYPGAGGYGYRKRSRRWEIIKRRKYGHDKPNVATGRMRDSVLRGSRLTATATRWRIYARLPSEVATDQSGSRLQKKSGRPKFKRAHPVWQRAEIEVISRREIREFLVLYRRLYLRGARSPRFRRKRRARGR